MICPACGANLADDLKFCTQCGTALEAAPVVEEPVAEAPVVEEPVAEAPVIEEPVIEEPVVEEPVVEEPVAEVACDACAVEPEAAQEPVFDTEIAPETFDQLPEEAAEPEQPADKKPLIFGIVSLVLGVISLIACCCLAITGPIFGIAAVVFGVLGLINAKKTNNKTALILSIAGLALGGVGIIASIINSFVGGLMGASMFSSGYYF